MNKNITSRLEDAIIVFGRFLRQAGCPIGTGELMNAVCACAYIQISNREDFRQALKSTLISDYKLLDLFDQLFDIYWRNPDKIENVSDILKKLNESRTTNSKIKPNKDQIKDIYKKTVERLNIPKDNENNSDDHEPFDVFLYSPDELLKEKRFENYTNQELEEAKKFIHNRKWILPTRKLRRLRSGKIPYKLDIRNTIRKNIFPMQDFIRLNWKQPKIKERSLVVLVDISGSMDHYTKILLHFIHTIHSHNRRIEAFTFGTRLTRISQYLRQKSVNDSLEMINDLVRDWSGGTQIGETIQKFNFKWARRVLSSGAVVIIITDGWDTGNIKLLNIEFDRLRRSCHKLIWLNPNLGYEDFQPLTSGVQSIMKHVDRFLPIHNLSCLSDLGEILSNLDNHRRFGGLA